MKRPLLLFALRLFFYLSLAVIVHVHPGIVVSYDRVGQFQWFIIIPLATLFAFFPAPWNNPRLKLLIASVSIGFLSVWAAGFSIQALSPFFAGAVAFVLTLLLFHYPRWGKASVLEPFFLAWICFRLLVFSRAGEDVAGESNALTQFLLVWTAVVFLFHSAVVYFCLNPASSGGARTEGVVFGLATLAALALVILVLPADFIRHTVIDNLLPDQRDVRHRPSDNDWGFPDDGGGRQGRRVLPGDEGGPNPSLRGLSEHDWPADGRRRGRNGRGQRPQYTVKVVASRYDPVYMANLVRGRLDPVEGFLPFPGEPLNRLPSQRFFVTWFDNEPDVGLYRQSREVFSLSTLSHKFLPYRPIAIEPTILSENTGPFRFIHRTVSNVHPEDPLSLLHIPVRELSPVERYSLVPYLEVPLEEADRERFVALLDDFLESWDLNRLYFMREEPRNNYMERILAILTGFSDYQYNVNPNFSSTIADMRTFLFYTKDGDCVEFSNSAALLGRLAGIPSRVVTGYVAANSLQTTAHLRGLAALRSRIPLLQEFPFDELFLVTDAHGHSWPQFYVPDFGWLDFEATAFAIPPIGLGDGNLRDVVIPLLDGTQVFSSVRAFPWRAVFRTLASLAALALAGAYALRYGREAALYLAARRGGRVGARSLYLLLLARLAADGKPIKPVSKTAGEYARLFTGFTGAGDGLVDGGSSEGGPFAGFAALYTELRWSDFGDKAEMDSRFALLEGEYRKILAENRRKGLPARLARVFSLRALAYL